MKEQVSTNDPFDMNTIDSKVDETQVQELYRKYMPGEETYKIKEGQADIGEILNEVDHLGLRFLELTDVTNMSSQERQKYESKLARKIKLFDIIKKMVGIDLYSITGNRFLRKATLVRDKLQDNLDDFEKQINGARYQSQISDFYTRMNETLPEVLRENPKFSSAMEYLDDRNNSKEGGLRCLCRDLASGVRAQRDLDDLLGTEISAYEQKLSQIRDDIANLSTELAENPGNRELVQSRMEKNSMYTTYMQEKQKLEDTQTLVIDQLIEMNSDYQIASAQIELMEATVNCSRDTLRTLNAGIRQYEQFRNSKENVVRVGGHIQLLTYARQIADLINLNQFVAGQASVYLLEQMTEQIKSATPDGPLIGHNASNLNGILKERKREQVEHIKRGIDSGMYAH